MKLKPPPAFAVRFKTSAGSFTVHVNSSWAPPYAARFYHLVRLKYYEGARFYRMTYKDFSRSSTPVPPFVVQFGYMGKPEVDNCWDDNMTSDQTSPVAAPGGNVRGMVTFSMGAIANKTEQVPYCSPTAPYCALGFSTNIFINYGNNSAKLDAPGFAPFGKVSEDDMVNVVDKLYKEYGEVADLCGTGSTDVYCNGYGAACKGASMDKFLEEGVGNKYLAKRLPRLDYVKRVNTLPASGTMAS
eukprot:CAMPEP_0202893834 /NCGR_PEP_ID=MMETSP1392-20130828/3333_1 /ASSEMBLY_ACC=CAM_ASM_000868 /TAXON_ID=225041 /ORGANISM="Chlamydomonas chlamydogama, Strain SAG 11-48b" /LENGTH=242 /DNA_ID=CAMNT_0049578303 /DNA_START=1612 /DNA_END=2340 /DNA_ORIENTATION=-